MKYSVLVVDDERLIAKNIAKSIEQIFPDFHVEKICYDGGEAMEYIKSNHVHVVFTDIRMPEVDGLELAKFISENYPYIECVIISGYNDFEYAKSALSYQVKEYLLKPVNKNELSQCLHNIEKHFLASMSDLKSASENNRKGMNAEEIVSLVKQYINKNYQKNIDLGNISANFGFSAPYLTKIFTKYEHMTPSKYIMQYRINIAKQLLADETIPISVLSEQTGFSDQFHFSKTFKQQTGMSPSQYRAENSHR